MFLNLRRRRRLGRPATAPPPPTTTPYHRPSHRRRRREKRENRAREEKREKDFVKMRKNGSTTLIYSLPARPDLGPTRSLNRPIRAPSFLLLPFTFCTPLNTCCTAPFAFIHFFSSSLISLISFMRFFFHILFCCISYLFSSLFFLHFILIFKHS